MSRGGRGGRGGRPLSFIVQTYKTLLRDAPCVRPNGDDDMFPPLRSKPTRPPISNQVEYMLAVKKDLEARIQSIGVVIDEESTTINSSSQNHLSLDFSFFPAELKTKMVKKRNARLSQQPQIKTEVESPDEIPSAKRRKTDFIETSIDDVLNGTDEDIDGVSHLRLVPTDAAVTEKVTERSDKGSDGEEDGEAEEEEEELLEENDYIDTYFDNGESYGVDEEEGGDNEGESWYY